MVRGSTLDVRIRHHESDVYRHQILTSTVGLHAERVKLNRHLNLSSWEQIVCLNIQICVFGVKLAKSDKFSPT